MTFYALALILIILIKAQNVWSVAVQTPLVTLAGNASVRGFIGYAHQSTKPVYTFTGVPFAEKPVRFLKAETLKLWNGEKDATKRGKYCYQNEMFLRRIFPESNINVSTLLSEDCLVLHIWTPSLDPDAKRDVMVWIHGGAFVIGAGYTYDGTVLSSFHDVVHVSINYRLAGLGFLTTGDESAPGNIGLHDQLEALRWVKRYIHKFGGDPEKVTIYGESAGSSSVSFHLVSPLSKALYRRAISESGVSLRLAANTTALSPSGLSLTIKVATTEGCPTDNNRRMVDCLRNKPASAFVKPTDRFRPLVDGTFLPDTPFNLYSTEKMNAKEYLLGFNSHEGYLLLGAMPTNLKNLTVAKAKIAMGVILSMSYRINPAILGVMVKEYIGNKTTHDELYRALVIFLGDSTMVAPILDAARKHSEKKTTFLYYYNHKMGNPPRSRPDWVLADHTDEIPMVFGNPFLKLLQTMPSTGNYSADDAKISRMMMSYWTNFAKTGNPNGEGLPIWPVYDCKGKKYLTLNKSPTEAADYMPERMKLWTDIIPKLDKSKTYKGFPWNCGATPNRGTPNNAQSGILSLVLMLMLVI